ncbi:MAG: glycosyltransferase [Pseudomonadota bacterium]
MHHIALGLVTRRRPQQLLDALLSFKALTPVPEAKVTVIVVENDDDLSIDPILEQADLASVGYDVIRGLETQPGIPFARNAVLSRALALGADYLTFIDDDETALPNWLCAIYSSAVARNLDLAGGPVLLGPVETKSQRERRLVKRALQDRFQRKNLSSLDKVQAGTDSGVSIYTNNWLCRLDFVRQTGLRFDESFGMSGGTDTKFWRDAQKLGAQTGWVPDAIVVDHPDLSRFTLAYQYKRSRDQAISNSVVYERQEKPVKAMLGVAFAAIFGVFRILFSPFNRLSGVPKAVQKFGHAVGVLMHAWGQSSRHYK